MKYIIAFIIVALIGAYLVWQAPGVKEVDAYEECVQKKYGMSAAEAYQKLGVETCNQ